MDGISFNEIGYDLRVPGNYAEVRPTTKNVGVLEWPTRVLLIGPAGVSGGVAAANTPVRITRDDHGAAYFGTGSALSEMAAAFRAANTDSELWAMSLADASGATAATATIALGGTGVTVASRAFFYIGGRRVSVTVKPGDTAATVATALIAAITADPLMAATASLVTNQTTQVLLTCKEKGAHGNGLDVRVADANPDELLPAGVTAVVTAMAGGTGVPDITTAFARIASDWYTDLVLPWTDSATLGALTAELATRYTATGRKDCHGWLATRATLGQATALGLTLNSPFVTVMPFRGSSPSSPWQWAASMAGVGVFQLGNDPARQLRGLALPGILPPLPADRFSPTEQELLLKNGHSTHDVLSDGTVVLQRVITTYQRSNLNVANKAWLDVMVPKTMSRIRYDWRSYVALTYPRNKLADDGSPAAEYDDDVATPRRLHNSWASRLTLYSRRGWVDNGSASAKAALFQRNGSDRNRVDSRQPVTIIGNLMILASAMEFEA
jgi:phage tail sheath gpL-like